MPKHLSVGRSKKIISALRKLYGQNTESPRWRAWAIAFEAGLADPDFDCTKWAFESFGKGAPSDNSVPANVPPMTGIN